MHRRVENEKKLNDACWVDGAIAAGVWATRSSAWTGVMQISEYHYPESIEHRGEHPIECGAGPMPAAGKWAH
jgi:hypothetical protein